MKFGKSIVNLFPFLLARFSRLMSFFCASLAVFFCRSLAGRRLSHARGCDGLVLVRVVEKSRR
jgi:hypothetical protein